MRGAAAALSSRSIVDKVLLTARGGSGGQGVKKFGAPGGDGGDVVGTFTRGFPTRSHS